MSHDPVHQAAVLAIGWTSAWFCVATVVKRVCARQTVRHCQTREPKITVCGLDKTTEMTAKELSQMGFVGLLCPIHGESCATWDTPLWENGHIFWANEKITVDGQLTPL